MEPADYLNLLRQQRIVTPRMTQFLDSIILHVHNHRVVSVMLKAYGGITARNLSRVGLSDDITVIEEGLPNAEISSDLFDISEHKTIKLNNGLYLLKYSIADGNFKIISYS